MKKTGFFLSFVILIGTFSFAYGYNVGDKATDFSLKNVDGKMVSLADFKDAKGFIVVFTCNDCPYAQAYQDRIIELDKKYKALGYPVVAINPNDAEIQPGDSYNAMVKRAKEKNYSFPYLYDPSQETYRKYGATRTPHVFVLEKEGSNLVVKYIGAIDDNYSDASNVSQPYLAEALNNILAGKNPEPSFTKAIGCSIKDKKKI